MPPFESSSNVRLFPSFEEDEPTDDKSQIQQQLQAQLGNSHHVNRRANFLIDISLNISSQIPKEFLPPSKYNY